MLLYLLYKKGTLLTLFTEKGQAELINQAYKGISETQQQRAQTC